MSNPRFIFTKSLLETYLRTSCTQPCYGGGRSRPAAASQAAGVDWQPGALRWSHSSHFLRPPHMLHPESPPPTSETGQEEEGLTGVPALL